MVAKLRRLKLRRAGSKEQNSNFCVFVTIRLIDRQTEDFSGQKEGSSYIVVQHIRGDTHNFLLQFLTIMAISYDGDARQ